MSNEQTKPDVQVLLVSAQAAPNLLAALDPEMKPKEVILLVTDKMRKQAEALEKVFCKNAIKVVTVRIANERDFSSIENEILELAAARQEEKIALNVTGGTKLMALAAQTMAQEANWRVFYVDIDTDQVIWLGKDAEQPRKLATTLRLGPYLQGYGFKVEKGDSGVIKNSGCFNELRQTLIKEADKLELSLSQVNYLAQQAENDKKLSISLSTVKQKGDGLKNLLLKFEQADVLTVRGDCVVFRNKESRAFAKGGWLEFHVFHTVSRLKEVLGIRDTEINLTVVDGKGVKNELDVAFMARNRLFVIECKTARMMDDTQKKKIGKANDALFKLAEISHRVGGLGARGMLVSYRKIGDAAKGLAGALGITVIEGYELNRLDEFLKTWVKPS